MKRRTAYTGIFRPLSGSISERALAKERRATKAWWGRFCDVWSAIGWEMSRRAS